MKLYALSNDYFKKVYLDATCLESVGGDPWRRPGLRGLLSLLSIGNERSHHLRWRTRRRSVVRELHLLSRWVRISLLFSDRLLCPLGQWAPEVYVGASCLPSQNLGGDYPYSSSFSRTFRMLFGYYVFHFWREIEFLLEVKFHTKLKRRIPSKNTTLKSEIWSPAFQFLKPKNQTRNKVNFSVRLRRRHASSVAIFRWDLRSQISLKPERPQIKNPLTIMKDLPTNFSIGTSLYVHCQPNFAPRDQCRPREERSIATHSCRSSSERIRKFFIQDDETMRGNSVRSESKWNKEAVTLASMIILMSWQFVSSRGMPFRESMPSHNPHGMEGSNHPWGPRASRASNSKQNCGFEEQNK